MKLTKIYVDNFNVNNPHLCFILESNREFNINRNGDVVCINWERIKHMMRYMFENKHEIKVIYESKNKLSNN